MAAYFVFAYDLWVVNDTGRLDRRFLERLKNRDQFQGARHELFAEATCIRGNFAVDFARTKQMGRHATRNLPPPIA